MTVLAVLCFLVAAAVLALAAFAGRAAAAGCPNEAVRTGPSTRLPGCRAYEMVSPVDKNGASVNPVISLHSAPSGEAVSFYSTSSFAGSPASPLENGYIARRGPNWATEAIDPPQFNQQALLLSATPANNRELSLSIGTSQLALMPGATEGGSNLYLRDNATGNRSLLATSSGSTLYSEFNGIFGGSYIGGTPDWSHIVFQTREPLSTVPAEPLPAPGVPNIYEFSGGELHLVNVLPDGTVDPSGAHIGSGETPYQHAISDDGSKIFFQLGPRGSTPLYVRENGTTTKPVSASHVGANAGEVQTAELGAASADGSVAIFSSPIELVEGAGRAALYRYDTASETTTALISNPPVGGAQVRFILGASQDGSYVYFTARAALTEDATVAPSGGDNIYAWHDGTIKFIAQTIPAERSEVFRPKQWSISPDGRTFAVASFSPLTEEDVSSPNCPADPIAGNAAGDCLDVYGFEFDSGALTCLSCDGGPGNGNSIVGGQLNHEVGFGDEYPHAVLDDGTIFFDTPNALLPRDADGVGDVYAWRGGSYELISTGTSEQPSSFGDATLDGGNVFFLTSQALVKQDTDESVDVYDDRAGGGLAAQWPPGSPPPCEGEGCRGASPAAPAVLAAGSTVAASGSHCGKGTASARAAKQRHRARRLLRRASKVAKHGGKAAKARSRRLRHRSAAARKRAHRLQKKAKKANRCGRKSR